MRISNTTELEDGKVVTFQGELSGVELDYVIQVGLNFLLYSGLLKSSMAEEVPEQVEMH
jgi:hypothetical protein